MWCWSIGTCIFVTFGVSDDAVDAILGASGAEMRHMYCLGAETMTAGVIVGHCWSFVHLESSFAPSYELPHRYRSEVRKKIASALKLKPVRLFLHLLGCKQTHAAFHQ